MATLPSAVDDFAELFPAVYMRFHRRDPKRSKLSGSSRAVMLHLASTGPLTIGEMALHLGRAQSVVSELVDGMERKKLLERMRDPRDRRRALVWLTDAGFARYRHDRDILSRDLLTKAMERMTAAERTALLRGMRALLQTEEKRRRR